MKCHNIEKGLITIHGEDKDMTHEISLEVLVTLLQ